MAKNNRNGIRNALGRQVKLVRGKTIAATQLQGRTASQLSQLAASSGRLYKLALAANNPDLAASARAMAFRAGRLAKAAKSLGQQHSQLTAKANRELAPAAGLRSENVRIASSNVGIANPRSGSGRAKGPVKMVSPTSLGSAMAKLRAAQGELFAMRAQMAATRR